MTTTHDIANKVATATNAADEGVVVTVEWTGSSENFVIWAMGPGGKITDHRLDAASTSEERLTAHVRGFIENHRAAFAQRTADQRAARYC